MKFTLFMMPMIFLLLTQPLTMSLLLTMQTMMTGIFMYFIFKNIWMSLTLMLVMVGGLMMSFVYVSSLMPSEPYSRTFMWFSPMMLIPFMTICLNPTQMFIYDKNLEFMPLLLFNNMTYMATIMIITILMITLLIVCANTLQMKCPMRSYN